MVKAAAAVAIVALLAAAAVNLGEGLRFAMQYSQDFQWSPTVLLHEGHDPYAWYLAGNANNRIMLSQEPNYLHLLYVLLLPFAYLTWPAAKFAWAICNIAAGALTAHLLARAGGLRGVRHLVAVGVFLAATPFAHTLGNGQQSLIVLLAITLAWLWRSSTRGGLALAVGAVKYSFLPPLGLWLLLERRWLALAAAAFASALGLLAFVHLSGADVITAAFEPLSVSAKATHDGLGDILSLARALGLDARLGAGAPYVLGLACAGVGVAILWRFRAALDDLTTFALLNLISLFSFFHNLYDYVLLLPLFCRALTFPPALRLATLAYVGYFWFALKHFGSLPAMKSPAAIAATAFASILLYALILRRMSHSRRSETSVSLAAPSLIRLRPAKEEPCPSPTV